MQILGLYLTPTINQKFWGSGPTSKLTSLSGDSDVHSSLGKLIQVQFCLELMGKSVKFWASELEAPLDNRPKATSSNWALISNKSDNVTFKIILIINLGVPNSLKKKVKL